MKPLLIAIDGPAASGKGTLARRVAAHFRLPHLDSGLLYRAVGWAVAHTSRTPAEAAAALQAADLDNPALRTDEAGQQASKIAAIPEVRDNLLKFQKDFAYQPSGAVLDGRDIGTVICPDAPVKLFVTASLEARAERRFRELRGRGADTIKPRSCRDGGAGPSRQRTGGCTDESRTRCLPSRYQRHGCRRGLRRRSDIHSEQGLSILRAVSRRRRIEDDKRRLRTDEDPAAVFQGSGSAGLNRLADGRQRFARDR